MTRRRLVALLLVIAGGGAWWALDERGFDGGAEAAANRELRTQVAEWAGAVLLGVEDRTLVDDESGVPYGVETTWRYHLAGGTLCRIAAAFEAPLRADGWVQYTLHTKGDDPRSPIRNSQLRKGDAQVIVAIESPPDRFAVVVQAHARPLNPLSERPPSDVECVDRRPAPPEALTANAALYARLPLPAGAVVTEQSADGGGSSSFPGATGFGSSWRLRLPEDADVCTVAGRFETVMAAAGWERFTQNSQWARTSQYFRPPAVVEVSFQRGGQVAVFVMQKSTGAHPGGEAAYVPGATPEQRGQPAPCQVPVP